MPEKNSTSVTRKNHIPSRSAECCCSRLSKWCFSTVPWPWWVLADNFGLLRLGPDRTGRSDLGGRVVVAGPRGFRQPAAHLVHADGVLVRAAHRDRQVLEVEHRRR